MGQQIIKVTPPAPPLPDGLEKQVRDGLTQVTDADFYFSRQSGRLEPKARALQKFANQERQSTLVLTEYSDGERVLVEVIVWKGEAVPVFHNEAILQPGFFVRRNITGWIGVPSQVETDSVEIVYTVKRYQWLFTEVAKARYCNCGGKADAHHNKDHYHVAFGEVDAAHNIPMPTPADEVCGVALAEYLANLRNFAVRTAKTQAEARCQRKLLGAEWREPEELRFEDDEIGDVSRQAGKETGEVPGETPTPGSVVVPFGKDGMKGQTVEWLFQNNMSGIEWILANRPDTDIAIAIREYATQAGKELPPIKPADGPSTKKSATPGKVATPAEDGVGKRVYGLRKELEAAGKKPSRHQDNWAKEYWDKPFHNFEDADFELAHSWCDYMKRHGKTPEAKEKADAVLAKAIAGGKKWADAEKEIS